MLMKGERKLKARPHLMPFIYLFSNRNATRCQSSSELETSDEEDRDEGERGEVNSDDI